MYDTDIYSLYLKIPAEAMAKKNKTWNSPPYSPIESTNISVGWAAVKVASELSVTDDALWTLSYNTVQQLI